MSQNPEYMKENFVIKIETMHLADQGETENVGCIVLCVFTLHQTAIYVHVTLMTVQMIVFQ